MSNRDARPDRHEAPPSSSDDTTTHDDADRDTNTHDTTADNDADRDTNTHDTTAPSSGCASQGHVAPGRSGDPETGAGPLADYLKRNAIADLLEDEAVSIAIHDTAYSIVWANKAYREGFGLALEDIAGRKCYTIWNRTEPCSACPVHVAIATGAPKDMVLTRHCQPAWPVVGTHWISRALPIKDEGGTIIGIVETAYDMSEQKAAEAALAECRSRMEQKLSAILPQEPQTRPPTLGETIDVQALQSIMDDFYALTNIGIGVLDLEGKILVRTGWQDICMDFHRIHPETCRHCLESDTILTRGVDPGTFRTYRCKNHMWDMVTPITLGDQHVGNLFLGQFFFEDDEIDRDFYRAQARRYGFDEAQYLAALDRVPRWSHAKVDTVMRFYAKFAQLISSLSYSNQQLAHTLDERDQLLVSISEREAMWRGYVENAPYGVFVIDEQGRYLQVNPAASRISGYSEAELTRMSIRDMIPPAQMEIGMAHFRRLLEHQESYGEAPFVHRSGEIRTWHIAAVQLSPHRFLGFVEDVTDRKLQEAEHAKLQRQLQQAMKMESIGRLAGGVAHDFNNMLSVILGHADLALDHLEPGQPLHDDLAEIKKAAQRSANLTRQLLAFARKQTVSPEVLDLNKVVSGMLKMLRRLIGEDIKLVWEPGSDIWPVRIDASQVDQILANLAVNARDAIDDVGRLVIETANIAVDEIFRSRYPYAAQGDYVMLAVSDDGCGMDRETLAQVFEPFFTTKEVGHGTGLGLATVYGIVKQNGGFVNVYSEPGRGTTLKLYFPRNPESAPAAAARVARIPNVVARTILLVEDELSILRLGKQMLESLGYHVLAAVTPSEAIRIAEQHAAGTADTAEATPPSIDLLMTDVIMPEMNGWHLAQRVQAFYPQVKQLFMSGYTANAIAEQGVLNEGVHFIAKPFSLTDLARKVHEAFED